MVGKTERTLKRNILSHILQIAGRAARYVQGSGELFVGARRCYVAGANDERSESKIRGMTLAGAYGDEITLWPESFFKMLLSRLSVKDAQFFGTTNPDSPYHWLKRDYLDRQSQLDFASWHFCLDDNPHLDPDYVSSLKREYTGLWYRRFLDGQWVMADGAVYDMWDESAHVVNVAEVLKSKKKTGFQRYFVGVDYGTNNPCTYGLYGYDPQRKRGIPSIPTVYLVKEYYWKSGDGGRQKTDAQYADDFREFLGDISPAAIYVDPSAASFISELRHAGWGTLVQPARNDVIDGIRFLGTMLHAGKFLVDQSCQATRKEFASYVWDTKSQQKGEDKPVKMNDHAMDRNRYAIFSHFYRDVPIVYTGFNLG